MDPKSFDRLSRSLIASPTRRTALTGLAAPDATAQARVCRPLGKLCFPDRGVDCCQGATCQEGRCRCPARARPCRGKCLLKSKCCRHTDCPGTHRCANGRCQCPAGTKRCQGHCISREACCRDGECDKHEACVRGRCACATGAKRCGEQCIPDDQCCTDSDCASTEECVQGACQPQFCARPGNQTAICATYEQGDVRCCRGTCPPQPTCLATGSTCEDGGSCADCCAAAGCFPCMCIAYVSSYYEAGERPPCAADQDCNRGDVSGAECQCGSCCLADGQRFESFILRPPPCQMCCSGQCHGTGAIEFTCGPAPA